MKKNLSILTVILVLVGILAGIKLVTKMVRVVSENRFKTNLVLSVGERLYLVNVDPKEKQVIGFVVPSNMLVPVVGMQGDLRSNVLWKFGEGEKRPVEITERSLEQMFGVVTDGVIHVDKGGVEMKQALGKALWSLAAKTNLSWSKRLLVAMTVKSVNEEQVKVVPMPETVGVVEKLPDGSEVITLDRQRLSLVLDDYLTDDVVMASTAPVYLINSTGVPGMAKLAERQIKNEGGLVVDLVEANQEKGGCVYGADKKVLAENHGLIDWLIVKMGCQMDKKMNVREGEITVKLQEEWGKMYQR